MSYPKELVYSEATPEDIIYVQGSGYSNLNTVIAVPTRGMIPAKTVLSWKSMLTPLNSNITHAIIENMEVGDARNYAVRTLQELPVSAEYLFFLDDDIIIPPDILIKLSRVMRQENYDIISGLYHKKDSYRTPIAYRVVDGIMTSISRDEELSEKVIELDIVPMGCTLIRKSIFQKMNKPYFKTVDEADWNHSMSMTEDVYFCLKAKEVGAKIGVHTGIRCGHINTRTGVIY